MNQNTIKLLEYDRIKDQLKEYAVSEAGKAMVEKLEPSSDISTIEVWLKETSETRAILNGCSSIPLHSLTGMEKVMAKLGKDIVLQPDELTCVMLVLRCGSRLKRFMSEREMIAPLVTSYAASIHELKDLEDEIDRCIRDGRIDDKASPEISRIRKKILITEDRINSKLESILRSPAYKDYIQENLISVRGGRYVIPVKREYRKNLEGSVLDTSTSGSTVFLEPAAVKVLQDELNLFRIEQEKEEYRILSYLTGIIDSYKREISINIETMSYYDFLFAKAKLSRSMEGKNVRLNTKGYIDIRGGIHPLIGKSAVPLRFKIGEKYKSLIITGPNTGGKTVALKTIGLLTMMVQSGLHVPIKDEGELAVFRDILVDIGDGQSIEQSLSTFSSHVRNISSILGCADPYTLVIVDELGTGTDPGEGMGLAVAVLEELYAKGATTIATTHYGEIKGFAEETEGFENGCMEFDIDTLKPLYRLKIGKPGESNAFLIALRLGMDKRIIERAHEVTYKEKKEYSGYKTKAEVVEVKDKEAIDSHKQQNIKVERTSEIRGRTERQKIEHTFKIGDCVYISSMNRTGIVCELENNKGELGVQIMKNKFKISKKRLSLYIDGKELYPDQYDYDIVFDSKENRKKKHIMSKRHVKGMIIEK